MPTAKLFLSLQSTTKVRCLRALNSKTIKLLNLKSDGSISEYTLAITKTLIEKLLEWFEFL